MNKSVFPLSLFAAVLLCGCTPSVTAPSTMQPEQPVSFSCRPTDLPGAGRDPRFVTIARETAGPRLRLVLDKGRTEILSPVSGSGGQLFSDAEFAVRIGDDQSILTDVENIQTYDCSRIGMWQVSGHARTS